MLSNIEVQQLLENNRTLHEENDNKLEVKINAFNETIERKIADQEEAFVRNIKETEEMIEEMKRQNLQMLGFLTAIISFTVGTFQVLQTQSFTSAFILLLTL